MGAGLCERQDSFLLSTDFPDLTETKTSARTIPMRSKYQ